MAFAYFVVFPIMFGFFASVTPDGVAMMTDIGQYLDFVLTLFFAFGVAFEIPIATFLLIWAGIVSVETLVKSRPYVIVGCFVVGMFLTPGCIFPGLAGHPHVAAVRSRTDLRPPGQQASD